MEKRSKTNILDFLVLVALSALAVSLMLRGEEFNNQTATAIVEAVSPTEDVANNSGTTAATIEAVSPTEVNVATKITGSKRLDGVYFLKGYNVHSFVDEADSSGSVTPRSDGCQWDEIYLVDPLVDGERVIIDNDLWYKNEPEPKRIHYFFRDQVEKLKCPVFMVKKGTESYVAEGRLLEKVKEDGMIWDQTFLAGPKIDNNGLIRVHIDEINLYRVGCRDGKVHFFYRHDLVLLNPSSLD